MPQAGWYPDPAGVPGQERYWDGASWSSASRPTPGTTGPAAGWTPTGMYDPQAGGPIGAQPGAPGGARAGGLGGAQAGAASQPAPRRRSNLGLVLGVVALVLATVVLGLFLWRPWDPRVPVRTDTPPSTSVTTSPNAASASARPRPADSANPSAAPAPSQTGAAVNCAGGAGRWNETEDSYHSYGLSVTPPQRWGFRLDADQWTWLNQAATYTKAAKEPVGFALGGVLHEDGFGSLDQVGEQYLSCLTRYGVYNAGTTIEVVAAEEGELAGLPARRIEFRAVVADEPTMWNRLYVVDTDAVEGFATLLVFAPADQPAMVEQAQAVVDSATS